MSIVRKYIKRALLEKATSGSKDKRTLYHIGRSPAAPKPKMRWFSEWDDEAEDRKTGEPTGESVRTGLDQAWVRSWLDRPVESGVFMTTNAFGIAKNHGIYGNVYAYKVPEWVIKKSGGLHRYDYGSEVLIPEDVWHEAEKEIEFMGKSLSRQELSKKLSSSDAWDTPLRRSRRGSMKKPGWISDEDWEATQKFTSQKRILQGLRATKHLKSAIKMMTQPEAEEALAVFEKVHEEQPPEIVKGPRDKKGIVVPWFDRGPSAQDKEIMALLKKYTNESMIREYLRCLLTEVPIGDVEWVEDDDYPEKPKKEPLFTAAELEDYFEGIPETVNIYIAHTDDFRWAAKLPYGNTGKIPDHIGRGTTAIMNVSDISKKYPLLAATLDPSAINLLYVYPKTFAISSSTGGFVPDVTPHYIGHDLHHILELHGRGDVDKQMEDEFTKVVKNYIDELLMATLGPHSEEYKDASSALERAGRGFGSNEARTMYTEMFPDADLVSGDPDLWGDLFSYFLKSGGKVRLGTPAEFAYDKKFAKYEYAPENIPIRQDAMTKSIAADYAKEFEKLLGGLLTPLVGKVGVFNAFHPRTEDKSRASEEIDKQVRERHQQIFDYFGTLGGEWQGGRKIEDKPAHHFSGMDDTSGEKFLNLDKFKEMFPDVNAKIESLGYDVLAAGKDFNWEDDVDTFHVYVHKRPTNESLIREYTKSMLIEQNVLAQGMCFPFAYQKAEEWFEAHFTKGGRGRRIKRHPDLNDKSKFKVVHGTVTDKWKKPPKPVVHGWVEMGDLVFDDQTRHTKPGGVDREIYYDMYQPVPKKEFTAEEAITNCVMYGGEGPWDDELHASMRQREGLHEKVSQSKRKKKTLQGYIRNLLFEELTVVDYRDLPDPNAGLKEQFDAFMADYKSMSQHNPIGFRGDRFWPMEEIDGVWCLVKTNVTIWDGAIHFGSIQTVPPEKCEGKGFASKVMSQIIALADRHQVPMSLDPVPFGQKSLSEEDLQAWYTKVGFAPNDDRGGEWWRDPQ
jgi:hypothetical protein